MDNFGGIYMNEIELKKLEDKLWAAADKMRGAVAVADYKFIVVNRNTLTPLVWEFNKTQAVGKLTFGKNNQIELEDPFVLGEELSNYLLSRPAVPTGIKELGSNDITQWLNTI